MRDNTTKQRIFDTAVRLFAQKGYHAVSVRELSSAAYLNEASLYYYYKNKESILQEIFLAYRRKLAEHQITPQQAEQLALTAAAEDLLQEYTLPQKAEDAQFMDNAFRIVCMEQFTNAEARDLLATQLFANTVENVSFALTKLREQNKIAPLDTQAFATAWAHCLLAGLVMRSGGPLTQEGQPHEAPAEPGRGLDFLLNYLCEQV